MKLFIGLIFAFLIFLYVYTFLKIRKKRKKKIDTVADYNSQLKKHSGNLKTKKSSSDKNLSIDKNLNYENYITKYNSQIDYIEKTKLLSDD